MVTSFFLSLVIFSSPQITLLVDSQISGNLPKQDTLIKNWYEHRYDIGYEILYRSPKVTLQTHEYVTKYLKGENLKENGKMQSTA